MAKFIEVTCINGRKASVNLNLVEEILEQEDGSAKFFFQGNAPIGWEMPVLEKYRDIKLMIQSDELR